MKVIVGFVIILLVVFGGFIMHGGTLGGVVKFSEILIIFGAGIGGMIISTNVLTLKLMLKQIAQCFKKNPYNKEFYKELMALNYQLIREKSRGGMKDLENHIENVDSSSVFEKYPLVKNDALVTQFIVDAYRVFILSANKMSAHDFESQLDEEIMVIEEELEKPSHKLAAMAESLPGIGILAAVMGIILAMGGLDAGVAQIGTNIAAALVGTFTGIFGCYCLFAPLAGSIEEVAKEQTIPFHCVKSIVFAFSQGHSAEFCANAARKHIESHDKPDFEELSDHLRNTKVAAEG